MFLSLLWKHFKLVHMECTYKKWGCQKSSKCFNCCDGYSFFMGTFQNNEACSFVENIARLDWLVFIGVFLENSKFIQHFNAVALFVCLGVITFFYTFSVMFDLKCCIQRHYRLRRWNNYYIKKVISFKGHIVII